MWCFAVYMTL